MNSIYSRLLQVLAKEDVKKRTEVKTLLIQIGNIFNIFITFGETLLKAEDYDKLYYEMIRNERIIQQICHLGILIFHSHIISSGSSGH